MAFINNQTVSEKRAAIKVAFPAKDGWKFSITGGNTSTLYVHLMEFPMNYNFPEDHFQLNQYYIEREQKRLGCGDKEIKVLLKILDIMKEGHWDKSDISTDYFHCAYYYSLSIGKWDKPAKAV